jgi:uncharacterized membrane protein
MFQELPNFHPMVVHFPIALIFIAVLADIFGIVKKQPEWISWTAVSLYILAALGAIAAFLTGRAALETVTVPAQARAVLTGHENLALYTMWSLIVYGAIRVVFLFVAVKPYIKNALIIPAIGIIILISITADRGGELVYAHGVGVAAAQTSQIAVTDITSGSAPIVDERGTIYWKTDKNSYRYFPLVFYPLKGADALQPVIKKGLTPGDTVLSLELIREAPSMWVTGPRTNNVQVTGTINASNLTGSFALIYNVLDAQNYDFVRFEENSTVMGRFQNGSEQIFDTKDVELSGWHQIKVVSSGTHFYAYVDDRLLSHWHVPAGLEGHTGILLNGTGEVFIKEWIIEKL